MLSTASNNKEITMPPKQITHYKSSLSLTIMRSMGQGDCGKEGYISSYHGCVNCKKCKEIIAQEQSIKVNQTDLWKRLIDYNN